MGLIKLEETQTPAGGMIQIYMTMLARENVASRRLQIRYDASGKNTKLVQNIMHTEHTILMDTRVLPTGMILTNVNIMISAQLTPRLGHCAV